MFDIGVDPSFRHTGFCLLRPDREPQFREVKTEENLDLVSSEKELRKKFTDIVAPLKGRLRIATIERQFSTGAQSSALQFAAQMIVLGIIVDLEPEYIVLPLPGQLKSYMKKVHRVDTSNKTGIVRSYREQTGTKKRISSHCVEGYYLGKLGQAVLAGDWEYVLPSKEMALIPGKITNGARS